MAEVGLLPPASSVNLVGPLVFFFLLLGCWEALFWLVSSIHHLLLGDYLLGFYHICMRVIWKFCNAKPNFDLLRYDSMFIIFILWAVIKLPNVYYPKKPKEKSGDFIISEPSSLVFLTWERQQVWIGDQKPIEKVYGNFVATSRRWLLTKIGPTLEFNRSWDENRRCMEKLLDPECWK